MNTNVIRTLTLRAKTEGVPESTADLNKLKAAHEGLAKVTDTSAKGQLSLADAVSKAERRFNSGLRAQQDFEKVQRQMNMAVAQNPALQERVNAVLALARVHFDQAGKGAHTHAAAMQAVSAQAQALAGRMGSLGSVLTAAGPAGLVAAAGLGALALAFHQTATAALALAERAGKLKDFSETTGFTVTQLQALEKAGAQVGVSSESVTKGLERFSVAMDEVKQSTGPVYDAVRQINPELANQLARTTSLAAAWDLLAEASKKADLEQRNKLARQTFGRGGVELTRLQGANADAGGVAGLIAQLKQVDLITGQQAEHWDTLGDKINENMKAAKQNVAAVFAGPALESMNTFSRGLLEISRIVREFDLSRFQVFFDIVGKGLQAALPMLTPFVLAWKAIQHIAGTTTSDVPKITVTPGTPDAGAAAAAAKAAALAKVREETIRLYNEEKRRMEVLGEAATSSERLKLKTLELAAAVAKDATMTEVARRNLENYNREQANSKIQATVAALGSAATATEQYQAHVSALRLQLAQGTISQETFNRALNGMKTDEAIRKQSDMVSALGELATPMDQYKLRVMQLQQQLDQGRISQDTFNKAVLASHPAFKSVMDAGQQFTNSLVDGLLSGKNMMDTLQSAVDNLIKSLASGAIQSLFKGDFIGAAIQAAIAGTLALGKALRGLPDWAKIAVGVVSPLTLLGSMGPSEEQKALEEAKKKFGGMAKEVRNFNAAASEFGLSSLVSAIQQIVSSGKELFQAAVAAEDFAAAIQIVQSGIRQINNTVDQFLKPRVDSAGEQIGGVNSEAQQIIGELNALNQQYNLGLNRTAEILAAASQKIADIQAKVTSTLQAEINDATGKGFINEIGDLVTKFNQFKLDQGATGVDTSLIDRWFTVNAQKIVDGAGITGDAFNDLIRQFPNLTGVVHEATASIEEQAEAQKHLQDELNGAARSITDYLAGLLGGAGSTLSPTATLANAQQLYNANLGPAQGGNLDAQNKFSSLADNLEKAARAVFASGQGYQDIRNLIIQQGLALPAVQQTTDPVVIAIRDSIIAIQNTTDAVDVMKVALTTAVDSGSATNVASALSVYFNNLDANVSGLLDFSEFVMGLGEANLVTNPTLNASDIATRDRLQSIFNEIDTNGDGTISRLESVRTSTANTDDWTFYTADRLTQAIANLSRILGESIIGNQLSEQIKALNGTANNQLQLLRDQLTSSATLNITASKSGENFTLTVGGSTAIDALRKIVANTYAISVNTALTASNPNSSNTGVLIGALAGGGTIPPFGLALVSEHSPGGGRFLRAGAEPITVSPFAPANDNSAVVAELREVRKELARLQAIVSGSAARGAQATVETGERIVEATDRQTEKLETVERQKIRARA